MKQRGASVHERSYTYTEKYMYICTVYTCYHELIPFSKPM